MRDTGQPGKVFDSAQYKYVWEDPRCDAQLVTLSAHSADPGVDRGWDVGECMSQLTYARQDGFETVAAYMEAQLEFARWRLGPLAAAAIPVPAPEAPEPPCHADVMMEVLLRGEEMAQRQRADAAVMALAAEQQGREAAELTSKGLYEALAVERQAREAERQAREAAERRAETAEKELLEAKAAIANSPRRRIFRFDEED